MRLINLEHILYPAFECREIELSIEEKAFAFLYYIFFIAQILSPFLKGVTLYLEILFVILNPYFWGWLLKKNIEKIAAIVFFFLAACFVISGMQLLVKACFTILSVVFILYSIERKIFYFRICLCISVFVAIIQFFFTYIDKELALLIGPRSISNFVWGDFATPTFSNFFSIFYFNRVSGLSREAGFLAALIAVAIAFEVMRKRNGEKNNKIYIIFLMIGFVLSFSKISVVIFLFGFVLAFKKFLDRISLTLFIAIGVFLLAYFWEGQSDFLLDKSNLSFLHRFSGYPTILHLDVKQLLWGVMDLNEIESVYAAAVQEKYQNFAGFSGFLILHGAVFTTIFFCTLKILGITNTGVFTLLLLTLSVEFDTNQNFVTMAYALIFMFFNKKSFFENSSNGLIYGLYQR